MNLPELIETDDPKQDALIRQLCSVLSRYQTPEQVQEVYRAYQYGAHAHDGQYRATGEAYICHPISVALILAEMKMDSTSVVAAILHDVLEDTGVDKPRLAKEFGEDVAELVDGVSKLTKIDFKTRAEAQAENMRKMFLAMAKDLRVILVKLADRLHNMRTIDPLSPERRRRIARETLDIYAPVANRLGMHGMRLELEDLGFKALFPRRRKVLAKSVKKARGNRKEIIDKIHESLKNRLADLKLEAKVMGREKNLYSIYRKMHKQHISFNEVFDVYAFRVIVESTEDCYKMLGVVHKLYKPVPGKFKDYIALPKTNGYQSLHTVLLGPFGVPIEIQIRTRDMHRMAEDGIAAHWIYKTEDADVNPKARAHEWLRNIVDMQQKADDSFEFIDNLKVELFPKDLFVFTPKGRIIKLPKGATVVDFAYAVHTDVGSACASARINKRMEPLHTVLKNGQTVEIITSDYTVANPNWLNFVVTSKARTAIRHHLKNFQEKEAIALGGQLLNDTLASQNSSMDDISKETLETYLQEQELVSLDALLMDIGFGNRMPLLVAQRLLENVKQPGNKSLAIHEREDSSVALNIEGAEGMMIHLANCCRPIPGDPIIGFFSPGRGVVVHRLGCNNTREFKRHHKNWLNVQWSDHVEGEFSCDIRAELLDQKGVFASIAALLSSYDCNIENINMTNHDGMTSTDIFTIQVRDRKHLARVMRKLRTLPSIISVSRERA